MTLSNQDVLNRADPNVLADEWRAVQFGDFLRGNVPQYLRHQNPVSVTASGIAATEEIALANTGKANFILRAYARAGTYQGEMTSDGYTQTAPGTGHLGISPNGNLMFAPSADVTNVDVTYIPERGDVVVVTLPVVTNAFTIPTSLTDRGVVLLVEAVALEGSSTGSKRILVPSASAASAGQARMDLAKATVKFNNTDAITRATCTFVVAAASDLNAFLDADAQFI